jgi:hypothetical protein
MHSAAPTKDLLKYFDDLHRHHVGVAAVIQGGKDAKLIAGLWRSHGDALVRDLMQDFFLSNDRFIQDAGYSVGVFVSQAAKLIARRARAPKQAVSWIDECDRLHSGSCASAAAHFHRKDREAGA